MRGIQRLGWVLAVGLCGCSITRDSLGELPVAGSESKPVVDSGVEKPPAADSGEPAPPAKELDSGMPAAPPDSGANDPVTDAGVAAPDAGPVCAAAMGCDATALPLDAYCKLEHARGPADAVQARAGACANTYATARTSFANACGGESVRVAYVHGTVDFYFDARGKLSTVTTLTAEKNGPCNASFYRSGDQRCALAGAETVIPCN